MPICIAFPFGIFDGDIGGALPIKYIPFSCTSFFLYLQYTQDVEAKTASKMQTGYLL